MNSGWHGSKWIRAEKRLAIYLRDGFRCVYCGRELAEAPAAECQLDHLQCRSRGGSNEASNLVTSCRSCNASRQDAHFTAWATPAAVARIRRRRNRDLAPFLAEAKRLVAERKAQTQSAKEAA